MNVRFFAIGGVILIVSGVMQAWVRPRRREERGLARIINRGTIWAAVCVAVGCLAILVGFGVIAIGPTAQP